MWLWASYLTNLGHSFFIFKVEIAPVYLIGLYWWNKVVHVEQVLSESESCSVVSDSLRPHGLYSPWNSLGQNTGAGSLSLLQGIFPTQAIEPRSPALQADSLPAESQGKPKNTGVGSLSLLQQVPSWPSNRTRVSCIVGRFFTSGAIQEALTKNFEVNLKNVLKCWKIIFISLTGVRLGWQWPRPTGQWHNHS